MAKREPKPKSRPKPKTRSPDMIAEDAEKLRKKALWTASDLAKLPRTRWEIPHLLPAPGVAMIPGPKSSLKSYIVLSMCLAIVYGHDWWDGTKLKPGMCFYLSGEDMLRVGGRRITWLQTKALPAVDQDGLRVVNVALDRYCTPVASGKGKGKAIKSDKIDLLNRDSVEALIADLEATAKSEGSRVAVVAIDPLTSLVPHLIDPVCRVLVAHLYLIANTLNCSVVIVNHTHLNNSRQSQGSYVLGASVGGSFLAVRDWTYTQNGVMTGLRTILEVDRQKDGGIELPTEWIGEGQITVGADGTPEQTCAMTCRGWARKVAHDRGAANRAHIAKMMPPGSASVADVIKLCGWAKAGTAYDSVREAIPNDWIVVQLSLTGEFRELRRVTRGKREFIECRIPDPAPTAKPAAPDSQEPEVAAAKRRAAAKTGAGHIKVIERGSMPEAEYLASLDAPLGDDPLAGFWHELDHMLSKGATLSDGGLAITKFLREQEQAEGLDGVRVLTAVFSRAKSVRAVMRAGAAKLNPRVRPPRKKKKKPDAPTPPETPPPETPAPEPPPEPPPA